MEGENQMEKNKTSSKKNGITPQDIEEAGNEVERLINQAISDTEFWKQANDLIRDIEKHKGITRNNRSNKELIISLLRDAKEYIKDAYKNGDLAETCKITLKQNGRIYEALLECPYCKNVKDFPIEQIDLNELVFFEKCPKCREKFAVVTTKLCQAYIDYYTTDTKKK